MGFYFRKSVRLGPIRINLSKSGIGCSIGVPGLRVGVRPDGRNYIHAGRYGLYYRHDSGRPSEQTSELTLVLEAPDRVYETVSASTLASTGEVELVDLLRRSNARWRIDWMVGIATGLLGALSFTLFWGLGLVIIVLGSILTYVVHQWEVKRRTIEVNYGFKGAVSQMFMSMVEAFNIVARSAKTWTIDSSRDIHSTHERKRNAGATSLIRRAAARVGEGMPPWMRCNVPIPVIQDHRRSFYFLPDGILVRDASGIGWASYSALTMEALPTNFIEDGAPPHDATIVNTTWLHPNKDGGPDRRFANNRELFVCRYAEVQIRGHTGINLLMQCSSELVCQAIRQLARAASSLSSAADRGDTNFVAWIEVGPQFSESVGQLSTSIFGLVRDTVLSVIRGGDRLLGAIAGEDAQLLHNFFRILVFLIPAIIAVFAVLVIAGKI